MAKTKYEQDQKDYLDLAPYQKKFMVNGLTNTQTYSYDKSYNINSLVKYAVNPGIKKIFLSSSFKLVTSYSGLYIEKVKEFYQRQEKRECRCVWYVPKIAICLFKGFLRKKKTVPKTNRPKGRDKIRNKGQ